MISLITISVRNRGVLTASRVASTAAFHHGRSGTFSHPGLTATSGGQTACNETCPATRCSSATPSTVGPASTSHSVTRPSASVGNWHSQLASPRPATTPRKATLSEKSAREAKNNPSAAAAVPPVFSSSTQSTCPASLKCASLKRSENPPSPLAPLATPGVGCAKRNHEVPPAGCRPSERPSAGMAALIALRAVTPSGAVKYTTVVAPTASPASANPITASPPAGTNTSESTTCFRKLAASSLR